LPEFREALSQSTLGTIIQSSGVALVAVLCIFLTRSIRRPYLGYWAWAWSLLALGLMSLVLAFSVRSLRFVFEPLYFLLEYGFCFFFLLGTRNYAYGDRLRWRHARLLLPAVAMAWLLANLHRDFSYRFAPQAAILAACFGLALRHVLQARRSRGATPGLRVMSVALLLLTLEFLQYVPLLLFSLLTHTPLPMAYSAYTPIYDLLFEVLLGFGAVTLVLEDAHRETEAAHQALVLAHEKLETLARVDSLTQALNRHAFYSLVEGGQGVRPIAGAVAVVDLDDLKPINDQQGHVAGDLAIRHVATAIRRVMRADDLVFRWGGDEFLALLPGVSAEEASRRFRGLEDALRGLSLPGSERPVDLRVSSGIAAFSESVPIERAIELADDAMYQAKRARKNRKVVARGA
jgi:diguanylate cyclase (GGDEF)-like protein